MEGSIRPETLLKLAQRHQAELPADTVEGLRDWYTFIDFPHFIEVYSQVSGCVRTPDDIELIAREFLAGQAAQNIRYSEVTYTALTLYRQSHIAFADQLAALNRANAWAQAELGVSMGVVIDIPRQAEAEAGIQVAEWAIEGYGRGVVAFGLGGPEVGNPPEKFAPAFDRALAAGLPSVPHAGETVGPDSIWGALNALKADRLGHGVRCLEDPLLVTELRDRQTPLEVCPISNVCLKVVPDLASHPLPRLLDEGLYVTLNSDDPPMFNTTLTNEYRAAVETFDFDIDMVQTLVLNGIKALFLPEAERQAMATQFQAEFADLRAEYLA